ncbi:MAG TPA: patatin-like phospholipase family protein [Prolixibacteraceae bacterium]|nr:patatin-like phospholipase family protein [Prolixibacteraceae bacterium]
MASYHIGLSMAGAVSAGSYTAGMLTQLFETIDTWYEFKEKGFKFSTPDGEEISISPKEMPQHEICIEALAGASAGGMCTALLAVCLAEGKFDRLYETWVNQVDLKPMLSTSDIRSTNSPVYSLFNVNVIDKIAADITNFVHNPSKAWPTYMADQIDMYLTLTNLEGIPYSLTFNSTNTSNQFIRNYADYKRFTLIKPGSEPTIPDDSTLLNPRAKTSRSNVREWSALVGACVASGAFPMGLKPRTIARCKVEYDKREWYFTYQMQPDVKPEPQYIKGNWADGTPDPIDFQYVDGGVMNNEPFELVRRRLALNQGYWRNPTKGSEAKSGVIMIDPFPSDPPEISGSVINKLPEVSQLVGDLFGSLRNQALFSQDLLYAALDPSVYSRFLVSPSRYEMINEKYEPASVPLASSILGAFGGFISGSFRNHDYELGKRNCYDFLQTHFGLPLSNPIVDYVKKNDLTDKYKKAGWLTDRINDDGVNELHMQIIPVIPENAKDSGNMPIITAPAYPEWPKVYADQLEELREMAYARFEKILDVYIDKMTDNWVSERAFNIAIDKVFLNKTWFAKRWRNLIEDPLRDLKLLK